MTLTPVKTPSSPSAATLTLRRPDDWHLHLRDGPGLAAVAAHTARVFGRAIVMPNLKPPVTTVAAARAYRDRILAALPAGTGFDPLMTLYLTDNMPPAQVAEAKASGIVHAVKYYPAGATTNSDSGVTSLDRVYPVLAAMEKQWRGPVAARRSHRARRRHVRPRARLRGHAGCHASCATFPVSRWFSNTSRRAKRRHSCSGHPRNIAATITPQHLLYSRNALFAGNFLRPHHLLPADPQARGAPAGADQGRHIRRSALLPRHGFGAPRETPEGKCVRMRRLLLGAGGAADVRRSLRGRRRARPPRRIREPLRRATSTACRRTTIR